MTRIAQAILAELKIVAPVTIGAFFMEQGNEMHT